MAARPLVFLTELLAAIPSIVYGLWGIFVLVPFVRQLEVSTPAWLKAVPLFTGPPLGVGMLSAALILSIMVIPFTLVGGARGAEGRAAGAARRRVRARRDALGGDPDGALLRAHRHRRRRHARLRPRARRDDGGDDGDRQQSADHASLFAPQYTMAAVIANEFAEAPTTCYLHALVEIGLVLFVITLIINVISRLFIWSHGRQPRPRARRARALAEAA